MTINAIGWPKLIGAFVIALGIAMSLKTSDFVSGMAQVQPFFDSSTGPLWPVALAVAGATVSVFIGLNAYRAREWARRMLVVITVLSIALCAVYAYSGLTRSVTALGYLDPKAVLWIRALFVGEALRVVSPPVFFLLILVHPDVARSFQVQREPPNERTADRSAI